MSAASPQPAIQYDDVQPAMPRGKVLLRIFLVFLAILPVLEAEVRVREFVKYGSSGQELYHITTDPASGLRIPAPNQSAGHIHINSRGFRSPEIPVSKPAGTVRLAFLGESNTFGAEASSDQETWPYLATKGLEEHWPSVSFDFVNAAVAGYTVSDSHRAYDFRVRPLQPDIVVINDASMDLYVDTKKLATEEGLLYEGTRKLEVLDRYSILFKLLRQNLETRIRMYRAKMAIGTLNFDPRAISGGFHDRLAALVDDVQQHGAVPVLVTFPYKARRRQSPSEQLRNCATTILYGPWMSVRGTLDGFDEYNRVIAEVAREKGAVLIDVRNVIPGDDAHFYDSVHYKDAGAKLLAAAVAKGMTNSPVIQEVIRREMKRQ